MVMNISPEYLINKKLLRKFIVYINPGLAQIPDQHLNKLTDGKLMNILHQFEYVIRGQGINVETLISTKEYQNFAKGVMMRENPLFYKYINKDKVLNSGILKSSFSPTLVKKKLILDIFYYKEYDKILSKLEWIKE